MWISSLAFSMVVFALVHGGVAQVAPEYDPPPPPNPKTRMVFVCHVTDEKVVNTLTGELQKAVGGLRSTMSFDVIVLDAAGKPKAFSPGQLALATDENKQKAKTFIDAIKPIKSDNPLPAIAAALAQKPDMIYVLTDAKKLHKDITADQIAKLNVGKTKINTILMENYTKEIEQVLQSVSEASGGSYRHVRNKDLQ